MKFDLFTYLTNQMRVKTTYDITHILQLFEIWLFVLHFMQLFIESNNFLLHFLIISQIVFSEFDEFTVFSGQIITLIFQLW